MPGPRPYIPLAVRVQVAERQAELSGSVLWPIYLSRKVAAEKMGENWPLGTRLRLLLDDLFPDGCHLDHDPALILRPFKRGRYTPDANDPDALIYRTKPGHQQKTTGRKPGALRTITTKGSDIGIKTKFARLEKKARKPRHIAKAKSFGGTMKIASRPFQKGTRKLHGNRKIHR